MKIKRLIASLFSPGFVVALILPGCAGGGPRVHILSASISGTNSTPSARVTVRLTADDVMVLAEQEIYSYIVVFECDNENIRYPASPRFGETQMDDFNALRSALRTRRGDRTVDIQGDVLRSFLNRLTRICVKMNGGSYLGRTLSSNTLEIRMSH